MHIAMSQPPQAPFFFQTQGSNSDANRYNGKIIIASLALLCFVVLFILALHIYAKWFWRRSQRRQAALWLRRQPLRFPGQQAVSIGLDRAIIDSLPTFVYKLSQKGAMECAVCLSELQENDEGRLLPKCNHSFHSECIDMWLLSHTTCPLCRASADPAESQVSSDGASDELEMGDADLEAATAALRTAIVSDAAAASSFDRPRVEGANAEPLPLSGWRWRRSTSDRFLQNAPSGVQFPTNVLFWGNNAHVSSHTNPPQMPGQQPRLEHGQRGARSLPHMALDIPRTVQTLMAARCASTGADDASPSTHAAEGSSQQQSKAPGAGLSVFKRLLSRERKVFPTEQEMGVRGHVGMSSGAAASGS